MTERRPAAVGRRHLAARRGAPAGALALLALLALAGCGGSDQGGVGELRWAGKPRLLTAPAMPRDRVLTGSVENGTLKRVEVRARDLRLVDASGHRVPGVATFLNGYLHGLYPPTRHPAAGLPPQEQRRIGLVARVDPGKRAPLTVAWRVKPGAPPPARVEYGGGSLPIPRR